MAIVMRSTGESPDPVDRPYGEIQMNTRLFVVVGLALSVVGLSSQAKPTIVVQPFSTASDVVLPYDLKQLQGQLVAEFRVMLGKQYEIVTDAPAASHSTVYTLDAQITAWRAGNVAKRLLVGMGSGREATDIDYQVTDSSGRKVLDRKDTIRTNFYSQSASTGTLAHPIAQKIAERIRDAKLN
jgi:hypothetical protein